MQGSSWCTLHFLAWGAGTGDCGSTEESFSIPLLLTQLLIYDYILNVDSCSGAVLVHITIMLNHCIGTTKLSWRSIVNLYVGQRP